MNIYNILYAYLVESFYDGHRTRVSQTIQIKKILLFLPPSCYAFLFIIMFRNIYYIYLFDAKLNHIVLL